MKRYFYLVAVALTVVGFGVRLAQSATVEDGVVSESDEEFIESEVHSTFTEDVHFDDGMGIGESGMNTCCTQGQTGVDNAHYLFVSTMDGKISALDVSNGGSLIWSSDPVGDYGPLISGSLSSTPMFMNDEPYNLVPSLDGSLYVYSYAEGILQPIPLNTNSLLQTSMMLGNDAVAGGKLVTVTGVDPITGKVRYQCGPEKCDHSKDATANQSVSLVMRRTVSTVRSVDSMAGQERWNLSVSEYDLSLSRRSDGVLVQPGKSHVTYQINPVDGDISAYDSCGAPVWTQNLKNPIGKVFEMYGGTISEISLFEHDDAKLLGYNDRFPYSGNPIIESSHILFGTFNHVPYIIPSPEARKELSELIKYQPTIFSQWSSSQSHHDSMAIRGESINSIISMVYRNSCPQKKVHSITNHDDSGNALKASHQIGSDSSIEMGNQGWFILGYKRDGTADYHEIADHSTTEVARRNTQDCKVQPERIPRRKQIKDSIKKAFNTEEPVSGLWRLAALALLLTISCSVFSGCLWWFWYRRRRSVHQSTSTAPQSQASTSTMKEESSVDTQKRKSSDGGEVTKETSSVPSTPVDLTSQSSVYVSKFLQDFDPVKCLGRGGFGVVFESRNKLDECFYAVKRIAVADNKAAKERVRREVRAMAKLDHPGIIRYYHTWIEHPPKGWQASMDKKILNEMSVGSSLLDSSLQDESRLQPKETKNRSEFTGNIVLSADGDQLDDTWDASFANDVEEEISESDSDASSTSRNSMIADKAKEAHYSIPAESTGGIVFGSESASDLANGVSPVEKDPFVPLVVLVATETSLQTSTSAKSYVYMYIQMELCQRETLHEWLLYNRQRDIMKMRRWFLELVDAISYIHSQGLIHRDLKPQNIFFASTGRLKVGDLGLATQSVDCGASDADSLIISATNFHTGNVGTRTYMSPEQLAGGSYNSKVDVFSLGLIFCELVKPFVTVMERIEVLQGLQKGCQSDVLSTLPNNELSFIKWLTRMDPDQRPLCSEILQSEYLQANAMARHTSVTFSSQPPTTIPTAPTEEKPDFNFLDSIESMPLPNVEKRDIYPMDLFTAASLGDEEYFMSVPSYYIMESNMEQWNCLMYAVYLGHKHLTSMILGEKPSLVDWQDGCGRTTLMMAASLGHSQILNMLIVTGAKLEAKDEHKRTALHYAVINKHYSCVDDLLCHKANTNSQDIEGMTPTLLACNFGYEQLLETLLKNGGDPKIENWNGETGESMIQDAGHPRLEAILEHWRLEQNDDAEVKSLGDLLRFFQLEQHLHIFERANIDLQGFLNLSRDRLNSLVYDLDARNGLANVLEYFTPYGVDPNGADPQQEYVNFFDQHVAGVEQSIAEAKRTLRECEQEEKQLLG